MDVYGAIWPEPDTITEAVTNGRECQDNMDILLHLQAEK